MRLLTSKKAIWIIIAFIAIIAIVLFSTKNLRKRNKLADLAIDQYEMWGRGDVKEHQNRMKAALSDYWDAAGAPNYGASQPWSAAFISWLFKTAGAGERFPYSASHSTYIRQAVSNRKAGIKRGSLVGYKKTEYSPKVGDLVCYPRQSGVSFDSDYTYKSHCDLVVDVDKNTGILTAIGGNVSNSVEKTTYQINSEGKIVEPKVHAVLSNRI